MNLIACPSRAIRGPVRLNNRAKIERERKELDSFLVSGENQRCSTYIDSKRLVNAESENDPKTCRMFPASGGDYEERKSQLWLASS